MEKYREAKKKLFEMVAKNKGTMIVNADMENPEEFLNFNVEDKYGYSVNLKSQFPISNKISNPNVKIVQAEDIELGINFSKFKIQNSKFSGAVFALAEAGQTSLAFGMSRSGAGGDALR